MRKLRYETETTLRLFVILFHLSILLISRVTICSFTLVRNVSVDLCNVTRERSVSLHSKKAGRFKNVTNEGFKVRGEERRILSSSHYALWSNYIISGRILARDSF